MQFSEISYLKLKDQVELYLKQEYQKANILFSNASPYGQILSVIENLHQLSTLYLKKAQNNFDISSGLVGNDNAIRNAAILAGHIPSRAISATGTLRLSVKGGLSSEEEIPGQKITITNKTLIKNRTNNLQYSISLGSDQKTYPVGNGSYIFLSIIQGRWERRTFTGNGEPLQTFSIDLRGQKQIENFNYEVMVNSQMWEVKKSLYDMFPGENSCLFRTGFNGGVDLIFGNEGFGTPPPIGSVIDVDYLVTDGGQGNIFNRVANDWVFVGEVMDGFGQPVDMENIFDMSYITDISFGANSESIEFTKNMLPIQSNNFVLGLPEQFSYEIKKLGVFSHVNAYRNSGDDSIHIVATPNIKLFKDKNVNYFTIDIEAFKLDNVEKNKILNYLKSNGNIILTSKISIDSPKLSYFVINIFVVVYEDSLEESVNAQIQEIISEYFLNLKHLNRIPKSEMITKISQISEIFSVDISILSKATEDYHRDNTLIKKNKLNKFTQPGNFVEPLPQSGYEENKVIGLDPILGDIVFGPDELPLIRGGWRDRNNIYFSDDIDGPGLKSVNIIYKEKVPITKKVQI